MPAIDWVEFWYTFPRNCRTILPPYRPHLMLTKLYITADHASARYSKAMNAQSSAGLEREDFYLAAFDLVLKYLTRIGMYGRWSGAPITGTPRWMEVTDAFIELSYDVATMKAQERLPNLVPPPMAGYINFARLATNYFWYRCFNPSAYESPLIDPAAMLEALDIDRFVSWVIDLLSPRYIKVHRLDKVEEHSIIVGGSDDSEDSDGSDDTDDTDDSDDSDDGDDSDNSDDSGDSDDSDDSVERAESDVSYTAGGTSTRSCVAEDVPTKAAAVQSS